MWNEDDRKWLYEKMSKNGVDTGSYDDFTKSLDNKEDRDWYYNKSLSLGLDVGSAEDFEGMMMQPKVEEAPQAVPAQQGFLGKDDKNWLALPVEKHTYGETQTPLRPQEQVVETATDKMAEIPVIRPGYMSVDEYAKGLDKRLGSIRKGQGGIVDAARVTMEGAFDRAYAAAKGMYYADEAERLTKGLLDEYSAERAKRLSQVEKDVENYNSARRWAVSNPYATDAYSEVAYRSNATKLRNADELGMMEEFAKDAKKRLLADENLKAKAEENAELLGMPVERYINEVAVPIMQEKMYAEWLAPQEERAKRNYNGFAAAAEGSLIGTLLGATRTDTEKYLSQVGQEAWRKNASLLGRAAAGAGSMFLDLPVFMGAGSLASVPAKAVGGQVFKQLAKNETKRLVARGVAEGAAQRYANYAVRNGLKNRILLNLSTAPLQSGLTFGMFDAGKAALNMSLNGEWDWKELGKSAVGGTLMGGALGVTSAVGGGLTHGLTGATKAAAKVAEFGVENAVFTEGGRLIGKLHGQQPENGWFEDYVESGATLLMIKAPNIVKNVSAIKGDKEASEVFAFNRLEREQLGKYGEDLNAVLESLLPKSGRLYEDGLKINEGAFTEEYRRVMSDPEVSMTTKAKLMGIVEGKMMPAPKVVDAKIEGNRVMTYDPMGRLVEVKEYATEAKANAEYKKVANAAEVESIAVMEDMYMRIKGYEADDVTVREWLAKNPTVTAEDIANIIAKNSAGEKLTEGEQKILNSLRKARHEGLNDVRFLNDVLAELDVDPKDVMSGIEKPIDERTEAENRAVKAYTDVLYQEIKAKVVEPFRRGEARRAEDIDTTVRLIESDRSVDETANNGMVYTTTTPSGEKIIITGGKVVLDNEGYIDVNQSEGLVAMFPDGQKKPVRPGDLREKIEVSNAEEMKAVKREEIKQEVAAERIAESGEVAKNEVLTYEEGGETHSIEVLGDNGDGTSRIISDGQEKIIGNDLLESLRGAQGVVEAQKGENAEKVVESSPTGEEAVPVVEAPKTALEQIPRNEKNIPLYEQVDSELAWDGVVEEAGGNEETAMIAVNSMIADKQDALKKAEKAKARTGATITEKIAAENERVANIEKAKADLAKWEEIAGVKAKRALAAEAESKRVADEAAAKQRAEEERLRAEREEAERAEREALNGVPDMVDDKPQDARARGYRRVNGHKVDRQEPVQGLMGKEIAVKFSDSSIPTGRVAVIEAEQLQPSHIQGQRNPLHFIDEAQPKERNDAASVLSARKIAENVRPEEITSSVTAYTGAPTVNTRGEAVQGNNRSAALRLMWENNPEQAAKYKQYLMDHAAEFGLNAEDVAAMKSPVLVNMLDVDDAEAITLGQFVAQDTESGGVERIKPKNVMQKMGGDMRSFANKLLASNNEEASFAELVDANGVEVLKWMAQKGYITPTQYKSAFDSKGNLTAEVKNDLRDVMYQSIFKGGSTQLEEMFNALPAKAQKAILATAFRDYDSPSVERMNGEVQNSIRAYYALARDAAFANAKNYKEAKEAAMMWARQYQLDDVSGESFLPSENFSNFAIELAVKFKGEAQKTLQNLFNNIYDLIQGTKQASLFEEADNTPRTLKEAIKETFNIDYNGQYDSNSLAGGNKAGQPGRQGTAGSVATGERVEGGERPADSTGGARGNGEVSSPKIPNSSTGETTIPVEANAEGGNAPGQSGVVGNNNANALQNGNNELNLQKENESDNESNQNDIPVGGQVSQSVPQGEYGTQAPLLGEMQETASRLRERIEADGGTPQGGLSRNVRDVENRVTREYAQENGLWIPFEDVFKLGRPSKSGNEHDTYLNAEQGVIYKVNNRMNTPSIPDLLDRMEQHNEFFPDSKYSLVGFTAVSENGDVWPVFAQEYVPNARVATNEEIDSYMGALGFNRVGDGRYSNGEVVIKDLKPRNVLVNPYGDAFVVDAEFEQEKQSTQSVGEQVQAAEAEVNTTPTDAQKEAGNYKKGHVKIGPFNISIEQPKGSVRSGVDKDGKKWEVEMQNTYGYFRGTEGVDGDHIDVFLSNDIDGWNGRQVFVVDQRNADGSFDEHKVMLGFNDINDAEAAYMSNYEEGWQGLGAITGVSIEEFEKWLSSSHRKTKAFAEYKNVKTDENAENGGEKIYSQEELAEVKEQLGELNATSAPEFAARLFSIKPWKTLEEANGALKELLANYGETLNGQSLAVMPFLDKAQGLISEYNKIQEPRFVEETLKDLRIKIIANGNKIKKALGESYKGQVLTKKLRNDVDKLLLKYGSEQVKEVYGIKTTQTQWNNLWTERDQLKEQIKELEAKKESAGKFTVKNNANFVSTYKTKDGKDIEYTSERAEGYGIQGGGTGNSYDGTGNSILQRQTDTGVPGANSGLNADKGEFCIVERVFTENGAFNFTSGEKIESADDVAYIFSALEDAAKEHSFVVYVKDGNPTVIELGMGSFNATMVDIPTASLAYSRINPDHVYFVHNHPSGNLICSDQDVAMLRVFEYMSDVPVTGVIINLKTGKYGTFDTERHSVIGEKRVPENEERLIVHTLDKQIFAPDYDPMAQPLVRSSQDVAQFLNSQRMGDRPKVSFLILSRANRIIGNIHTPFTDITTDIEAVARYINERIIQFGGENAILYGDFAISMDESRGFRLLQGAMERFGKTKLLDVVHVEGNFTKSAIDLGLLYEPETEYNVAKENGERYDSPEQDIPVESVQTQPMTFAEKITNSVLEASAKNKENLALRSDALRMFGRDVANVLKLMGKQREYDKSTVDQLVKLAKMYFKDAQLLGGLTPYQVGRVMTRLNNAVGKRDITDDANELVNILVDAHNKELEKMLEKQAKTKAKKVNASGVEVIGKLDKEGQLLLEEYNAGKELDLERIDERIIDLQNEAAEGKAEEAAARIRGLELARQYREEILKKRDEIKGLEQELKSAEQDAKDGAMDRAAYKEFRRATERAILESKLEMVDAYHGLIHGLGGDISSSAKRAKLFQQQQIDHVKEIQHNANSDLLGHPAEAQGETPDKWNSSVPRLFMSAMPTFQTMLKFFGEKAADGRGYLYERFIPQHTQASHNEYVGKTEAREKMRDKLTEIFGKKTTIENFMDMSRKEGAVLEYQEGGQKKTIDLTRGQVLYLYMINKMADGQMKLSRMGITDADVLKMAKELPEEMVRFADWVQEDFLTELREKYNKVHERMFGAPMAAIESYFPIKINKRSRGEKIEPGMNAEDKPSTVTGSVIKRTKNAVAIDLSADAMQVLLGHIDDMENWAAWAEFRRDVKSLLNYRHFQNQVKGMESLRYGSGEKLWKNFVDVANIAAGSFKPSSTAADKAVRNIAKGVVSSKIAFRYFTAVKQILSTPAFWSEVDFGKMMNAYLHQKEAWDWAMKNLPGFSKRWEGRASGNEILLESDADWKVWQNRAVQWLSKEGMRANAFIDALTVATGAKAVFETKYEMFKKAGYSEERAREKALNRAAEAYNESQQSSESAYLSPLQAEATFVSSVLTAYRNSPFGYNRKLATAVANLKKKTKKGFKQESIEYMTKQLMRDGLNEEQAKEYAKSTYRRSVARDAADVALYEFFLNYVWVLGPSLIYILGGDDDEKKKELNVEALIDGAMGGLGNLPAGETLTGAIKAVAEGDVSNFKLPQAVAMQDMETIADLMQTDPVRAAGEVLNILVAMGVGVNPQTFTDMFVALADTEDFSSREIAMFVLRLINAPNSKLELLEADEAMENYGANIEEITREYAEYQKSKRAPLTGWLYSDESEQKAIERYEKRFKKILDERFESIVENTDEYDMWYENSNPQMKAKLAKLRQKFLEGDKETTMEKLDSIDVTKKALFGSGYDEVNTVYYELSTAEDEDMAMMIDTKLKELQPMMDEYKKLRGDERKAYREENLEQIQFYNRLNAHKNNVNNLKGAMKKKPEEAQEKMEKIRKIRTKAIDLINNYNE